METMANGDLLADAGRLVHRHAMVWIRRLRAPIEQVWQTVSTKEGLEKWWLVPPKAFELRKGSVFKHHWDHTIADFVEHEYIDFVEPGGAYAQTGGMRFELKGNGGSTMFTFMDTWAENSTVGSGDNPMASQPGGPGTPWPGVAAGWHGMVDRLVKVFDDHPARYSENELGEFYLGYLRDLYRWSDMVQRAPAP